MEHKNNHSKTIKIFGIDRMVIISDHTEHFAEAEGNPIVRLVPIPSGEFPGRVAIRHILREEIRRLKSTSGKIFAASDHPGAILALEKADVAMVVGLHREGQSRKELYDHGADYVADNLEELEFIPGLDGSFRFSQHLPEAIPCLDTDSFPVFEREPVFFFDYDGTLTPIIEDPEKARLKESVRFLLNHLSDFFHVAIVSGRDLKDVRNFVQLDHLIYAGSHGFRIAGPGGISWTHSEAEKIMPMLERAEHTLGKLFAGQKGIEIERKYSALAIHYRNAPKHAYQSIKREVDRLIGSMPGLSRGTGKKIIEIRPSFDWHKGKAIEWILRKVGLTDPGEYLPVYIGDDITDEDAFRTLADHGTTILVGDHGQISAADLQLRDTAEVEALLHMLLQEAVLEENARLTFS